MLDWSVTESFLNSGIKLTTLQTHKKTFVKYMRELEEKEGHM
jgi:hypothetical protein